MKLNLCKDVPPAAMGEKVERRLLAYEKGENGYTVNLMTAQAGAQAPPHSHPHRQVVYMIEGSGIFLSGEEEIRIQAGDVVQIDPDVPHTFTLVETDARWLEFFTPVREDFLPDTDR